MSENNSQVATSKQEKINTFTPKISIVVPVYKVEQYLSQCILSILNQTFTDFELLLIDDGSPDCSGDICDQFAAKDSRIRVFHKENGGVSSARNLGLKNARGEWVTFVDSDDCLSLNALSFCVQIDQFDCEFIQLKTMEYIDDNCFDSIVARDMKPFDFVILDKVDFCENLSLSSGIASKFLKSELIKTNNFYFEESMSICEDYLFMIKYLCVCHKVYFSDSIFYLYRSRIGSAMDNMSFKKAYDNVKALLYLDQYRYLLSDIDQRFITLQQVILIDWFINHLSQSSYNLVSSKLRLFFLTKLLIVKLDYIFIKRQVRVFLFLLSPYFYLKLLSK